MTIFSDVAGNKFIGDCIYANHNPLYPDIDFLKTDSTLVTFPADLTALTGQAGIVTRNIIPQANIDVFLANANRGAQPPENNPSDPLSNTLLHFSFSGDSVLDDRYSMAVSFNGNNTTSGRPVTLFNDSGSTNVTNNVNEVNNVLVGASNATIPNNGNLLLGNITAINFARTTAIGTALDPSFSPIYVCGVANNDMLALYFTQRRFFNGDPTQISYLSWFAYACRMQNPNPNGNIYNNTITRAFIMSGGNNSFSGLTANRALNARHYVGGSAQFPLQERAGDYNISCADGQTPTAQWATDFYAFDDNTTIGDPGMGRVPNLLLATGTYEINKVVKIEPTVYPDAGSRYYLPVGTYANKTVLMRCFSSVDPS
jgi:hypothetical protein